MRITAGTGRPTLLGGRNSLAIQRHMFCPMSPRFLSSFRWADVLTEECTSSRTGGEHYDKIPHLTSSLLSTASAPPPLKESKKKKAVISNPL
jgi:hypothetical protein